MTDVPDPTGGDRERPPPVPAPHEITHAVSALREHLESLERIIEGDARAMRPRPGGRLAPGWSRPAAGEERWPVATALVVAILLQVALPQRLTIGPEWLLPGLEAALVVGLTAANPRHIDRRSRALRGASIALIALTSLANGWSSFELIRGIINGTEGKVAGPLLASGTSIYLTNIIVFALWYWEWDRGGPVARAAALRPYPDLLFPQMTQDHLAPEDWRPMFFDYLYVSYTNATAFSPTDTMPLAVWTKMMFLGQSAIALATLALVVARAVNIL
ncbi:hypothetical protein K6U06_06715 [Acidiferrimicrobium sp. IK]|uniref:hypothetical protein n=1 Tax=Acidiferrimicrobium sp. IK TaxID=2871700 RepID=UPI0021CB6CE3|nr:hypothetical protein [Acidiferrimicrobium sp. IK]MCU4184046.1 hypothetical protein [Acidiferrimicrobium sp. IK]